MSCGQTQHIYKAPAWSATHVDLGPPRKLPQLNLADAKPSGARSAVSLDSFTLHRCIGRGGYGKVLLATRQTACGVRAHAVKVLDKEAMSRCAKVAEHTRSERSIMASLSHPFVARLYFAFQTARKLYLVQEYCPGGDLLQQLHRCGRFCEERARFYLAETTLALEYLHQNDVVFRDLKPENVVLDAEGHVKLVDFGLAKRLASRGDSSARSCYGAPEYLAPEVLNQTGHGLPVDWYSLGALGYEMLTGLPPFYSPDRRQLKANIQSGELPYPSYLSAPAASLLMGLLEAAVDFRLGCGPHGAGEVREHVFFDAVDWDAVLARKACPPFRPEVLGLDDVSNFSADVTSMPIEEDETPPPETLYLPTSVGGAPVLVHVGSGRFLADKSWLRCQSVGLGYCRSPEAQDVDAAGRYLAWGSVVRGAPAAPGWIRVELEATGADDWEGFAYSCEELPQASR